MSPALAPGDYVIARRHGRLRRGAIVLYRSEDRIMIKRAIGLPGEEFRIDGGVVAIDGVPFDDPWWDAATRPDGVWKLSEQELFVLGDRRSESRGDSRDAGPIRRDDVEGIAVLRYWPLRRLGRLSARPKPPNVGGAARRAR